MKLTEKRLKEIIKEEIARMQEGPGLGGKLGKTLTRQAVQHRTHAQSLANVDRRASLNDKEKRLADREKKIQTYLAELGEQLIMDPSMEFPSRVVVDGGDPKSFKDYLQDDIEIDEGVMEMLNMPGQKMPGIKGRNIIPLAVMDSVLASQSIEQVFVWDVHGKTKDGKLKDKIQDIKTKYKGKGVTAAQELQNRPKQQGEE
jgi:hypothetical protein